jgi:hypothetical protein
MYEIRQDRFHFAGIGKIPAVASATNGVFAKTVTASGGSPTVLHGTDGLELTLDATEEVQNLCVNFGDVLSYDIDNLVKIEFYAKVSASLASSVSVALGMSSARNDDIDSLAAHASFRAIGDNNLLLETDDGTNDIDDKSAGCEIDDTLKLFVINFSEGIQSKIGVPNTGGKSAVKFFAGNARGHLRPVRPPGVIFDMSNYSGGLQPYVQIQKTSSTDVGSVKIKEIVVQHRF